MRVHLSFPICSIFISRNSIFISYLSIGKWIMTRNYYRHQIYEIPNEISPLTFQQLEYWNGKTSFQIVFRQRILVVLDCFYAGNEKYFHGKLYQGYEHFILQFLKATKISLFFFTIYVVIYNYVSLNLIVINKLIFYYKFLLHDKLFSQLLIFI